jgi:hypothetical protein
MTCARGEDSFVFGTMTQAGVSLPRAVKLSSKLENLQRTSPRCVGTRPSIGPTVVLETSLERLQGTALDDLRDGSFLPRRSGAI